MDGRPYSDGKTHVGLYFSPNVGVLLPVKNRMRFLLAAGYFRANLKRKYRNNINNERIPGTSGIYKSSLEGFKVMAGFNF